MARITLGALTVLDVHGKGGREGGGGEMVCYNVLLRWSFNASV